VSAAKRKASADTPAQKSAANCGRVTVDRAQFAEICRQLAAKSQRAAAESAAVARMLTTVAEKLETPPVANTPARPATGKARP
jgi:hypothetical protein